MNFDDVKNFETDCFKINMTLFRFDLKREFEVRGTFFGCGASIPTNRNRSHEI